MLLVPGDTRNAAAAAGDIIILPEEESGIGETMGGGDSDRLGRARGKSESWLAPKTLENDDVKEEE
jgi:hypothetical protein